MATTEYAKVIQHAESAVIAVPVSKLAHGDVILVPTKGKRAVRLHDGKPTLVFPRSGLQEQDGRKAGTFRDLDGHDPAVVGRVTGGWSGEGETSTTKPAKAAKAPKANTPKGRPAKGSQEAKDRMAAVRAARKGGSAPKAQAAPTSNREHFTAALADLKSAIAHLELVSVD